MKFAIIFMTLLTVFGASADQADLSSLKDYECTVAAVYENHNFDQEPFSVVSRVYQIKAMSAIRAVEVANVLVLAGWPREINSISCTLKN